MTGPARRRASLLVAVDLDPIPGFGSTVESWRAWLQGMLDRAAGHYQPAVTAERNDLRAQLAAAQAQLAEARERVTFWRGSHEAAAVMFDQHKVRAEAAEARLEAVRALQPSIDLVIAMPVSDPSLIEDEDWQNRAKSVIEALDAALSAAPQPEPERVEPDSPLGRLFDYLTQPEPPASDEPARCPTCGLSRDAHDGWDLRACRRYGPGPAAPGTPDGQR